MRSNAAEMWGQSLEAVASIKVRLWAVEDLITDGVTQPAFK